ncbi:TLD domain-containing protein [Pelagicoccus mobilis]|uniref:TLD domain-containing protein n=1 Tax=Pelagicoccus mobilis TaxID=415221 RepID=A0A934RZ74_9BACT|nr:TLD domain-containing protein [Pelagicoccus mobilis]MBK1877017.1 TLD domain-containing protein [Pelagicoccus mobilis]
MRLTLPNILWVAIAVVLSPFDFTNADSRQLSESEQLAIVRSWLPSKTKGLHLLFEYNTSSQRYNTITAKELHEAVDKAGRTVTIIEAEAPYDRSPRIIGGYNPYKWKSIFGSYERSPGRFIFDLNKQKKWERDSGRTGKTRLNPADYGLQFGEGDLVINPDLKSGSSKDATFSKPNSSSSVLFGQSSKFKISSIRVYGVLMDTHATPAAALPAFKEYNPPAKPSPVPDASHYLFESLAAGIALILAAILAKR